MKVIIVKYKNFRFEIGALAILPLLAVMVPETVGQFIEMVIAYGSR